MKTVLDLHRELLSLNTAHEIIRLRYAVGKAADLPDALGVPAEQCLSIRIFVAADRMVAFGLPVGRPPLFQAMLRAAASRTLRVATDLEVNATTGFPVDLVPPLPLPESMTLYMDASLGHHDVLYTASGEPGTALGIRTSELLLASRALVANLTTPSLVDLAVDLAVDLEV